MPESTQDATLDVLDKAIYDAVTLNDWAKLINAWGVSKGWDFDPYTTAPEKIALMHSELSEALEEYRGGKQRLDNISEIYYDGEKPEGFAVELVDCMIRILHMLGKLGVDVDSIMQIKMIYNNTRSYRHGGKRA